MITTCSCGTKLQIPDDAIGRSVRCPSCNAVFLAKESAPAMAPLAPPAEKPDDRQNPDQPSEAFKPSGDDFGRQERAEPRADTRIREDDRRDRRPVSRREEEEGPTRTSGKAVASLILAFIPCLGSIPGLIFAALALGDIGRSRRVTGKGIAIAGLVLSIMNLMFGVPGLLIALLVPAVQNVRNAAERVQSINNAKQVALAFHNHHATYNRFPNPKGDLGEKPELSWRVTLLPFIEQQFLFNEIDFTEPWDSKNNQAFWNQMPQTYRLVSRQPELNPTSTYFQVFTGPNTPFPSDSTVVTIGNTFLDGTSNTILFAEAASAVPWMKPEDMKIEKGQALPLPPQTFIAAFADGSVHTIDRRKVNDETLRLLIDPNDGKGRPPGDW